MASQYSTLILNGFFTTVVDALQTGGNPTLSIRDAQDVVLVSLTFPTPVEVSRTSSSVLLANPSAELILIDGTAVTGVLLDGLGAVVVSFDVGSATINPTASLILSSTVLYAGGMLTVNKVELTL